MARRKKQIRCVASPVGKSSPLCHAAIPPPCDQVIKPHPRQSPARELAHYQLDHAPRSQGRAALAAMEAAKLEALQAKLQLDQVEAEADLREALAEIEEAKKEIEETLSEAQRDLRDRKMMHAMSTLEVSVVKVLTSRPGGGPDDLFVMEVAVLPATCRLSTSVTRLIRPWCPPSRRCCT